MKYANVKCWACGKVCPHPQDDNFYLCSPECAAIHDAKAMIAEPKYAMNRHERRAAKKLSKSFH